MKKLVLLVLVLIFVGCGKKHSATTVVVPPVVECLTQSEIDSLTASLDSLNADLVSVNGQLASLQATIDSNQDWLNNIPIHASQQAIVAHQNNLSLALSDQSVALSVASDLNLSILDVQGQLELPLCE